MTEQERRQLDTDGYLVIENLMDERLLEAVRRRVDGLFEREGAQAGAEFNRSLTRAGWPILSTKAKSSSR